MRQLPGGDGLTARRPCRWARSLVSPWMGPWTETWSRFFYPPLPLGLFCLSDWEGPACLCVCVGVGGPSCCLSSHG